MQILPLIEYTLLNSTPLNPLEYYVSYLKLIMYVLNNQNKSENDIKLNLKNTHLLLNADFLYA